MKLLSDTVVEIDYFQLMDAVQQYFRGKCLDNAKVSWIVPCQNMAEGSIPYQGSYRVKMTWAADDPPEEVHPRPMMPVYPLIDNPMPAASPEQSCRSRAFS